MCYNLITDIIFIYSGFLKGGVSMISLVTDSSCDLPMEYIEKYSINIVPLTVSIDGKDYVEGTDIQSKDFAHMMLQAKDLPKTSMPSPGNFAEMFKSLLDKGPVLCLTVSSGLSGTYQSACLGRDLSNGDVRVVDTISGSLGHGLMLLKAAEFIQEGKDIDEIIQKIEEYKRSPNILVLLDTLENIVKGGRLSKFKGSVAKVLDIKVILGNDGDGKVVILEKVRGKKRFLKRIVEKVGEMKDDFSDTTFGITHIDNLVDAEYLKNEIMDRYHPKDVIINYMGSTMGTYAGKGGMILAFI